MVLGQREEKFKDRGRSGSRKKGGESHLSGSMTAGQRLGQQRQADHQRAQDLKHDKSCGDMSH